MNIGTDEDWTKLLPVFELSLRAALSPSAQEGGEGRATQSTPARARAKASVKKARGAARRDREGDTSEQARADE